jgi:hypothetical protein
VTRRRWTLSLWGSITGSGLFPAGIIAE